MLPVQPVSFAARNEELTPVVVLLRIGTGEDAGLIVFSDEVLVWKPHGTVNAGLARPVVFHKVPSLDDEPFEHTMERAALVANGLVVLLKLPSTELSKVLTRLGTLRM